MIIRLRSRDGLERIEVADNATLAALKQAINNRLGIPMEDMHLSKDAALLTAKSPEGFGDLAQPHASLASLGVGHGTMVYLLYHFERAVEPVYKKKPFEERQFGEHITISDVVAKQRRIERQDKPHVDSVSFDRHAANVFQQYVQAALGFSIKRGGLLYGTVDEEKNVLVEFIYEPQQEGNANSLSMQRHTQEEAQVDFLMELLGLRKVGWIFAASNKEREYIMSTSEVKQMATLQDELGEQAVTVLVSFDPNEQGGHVHFEAFQCSDQCVTLTREGWLQDEGEEPSGVTKMQNPQHKDVREAVIVAGKDADSVDNDWFLCPLKILQHDGPLLTSFPVENRLIPQTKKDLREHLKKTASRPYEMRLADGHLLLWLSKQPNLDSNDLLALCEAVREAKPLMEGYKLIIDSIAG